MKVLFIDDDLMTAEWVSLFLSSNDIETKTADSLSTAKECLRGWIPDLIVSDLSLNGDNAFSLLDHLATDETTTRIPVIALTGYSLKDSDKGRFQGYLTKPVAPEELLNMIQKTAQHRRKGE